MFRPGEPARFVLEVPAGFVKREKVKLGDTAQIGNVIATDIFLRKAR